MLNPRTTPQDQYLESQIALEQMKLLYGGLKFSLAASFVCAVIMYIALSDQVISKANLDIWAVGMLLMFSSRTFDAWQFLYADTKTQLKSSWRYRFYSGALIGGVLWGLLAWLGQSPGDEYQAIIVMCIVGVCAGSLSSLSFNWKALVLFVVPATVLLAVNLAMRDGNFAQITSIILLFFILFTIMSGLRIYDNTHQNIRLRLEADNREVALELMHQKQLLHTKQTPLAVIEFDLKLHVTDWNKAAEVIFGYTRVEAMNNNILKLIVPEKSMEHVEQIWKGVLDLKPVVGEAIETHTKSGNNIICEWYITPLTKHDKDIVGVAAMALDITEKKQFEEDLVNAKNESERANRAKSDFLSNMSHELRTPLNSILGFTQLLSIETSLDQKQKSHVNEINSAGQLLLELVNQILDLARIEEGYLNLSIEEISVGDVINECSTLIAPLAEQNQISITIGNEESEIDDIDNVHVRADYTRLKQILLNLLTNAIKYNQEKGTVSISCVRSQDDNKVRINVKDSGEGIPESFTKDIFEPFKRLDTGSTIEGTGIGLSISKQLIEKMGGTIGVESSPGSGSTFWIEIERCEMTTNVLKKDSLGDTPKTNISIVDKTTDNDKKILVAEDNPINQTLILNQLKTLGYEADLVKNGTEALDQIKTKNYDLLFTDCNMPVMDGYELARSIRDSGNQSISIIAITADAFPEKEQQCLDAGMNGRITKPVSLEVLKEVIQDYLE